MSCVFAPERTIASGSPLSSTKTLCRTSCQWKVLPCEYGSGSTVHRRFQEWLAAGFFEKIWSKGLEQYDELEGIGWEWQSLDLPKIHLKLSMLDNSSFRSFSSPLSIIPQMPLFWDRLLVCGGRRPLGVAKSGRLHGKSAPGFGVRRKESNGPRKKWGQNAVFWWMNIPSRAFLADIGFRP